MNDPSGMESQIMSGPGNSNSLFLNAHLSKVIYVNDIIIINENRKH